MSRPERLDTAIASARFPLGKAHSTRHPVSRGSAVGVRPWGLRWTEEARPPGKAVQSRYDAVLQVSVDPDGVPVVPQAATANSVSSGDGDEGPSEDWTYDFWPDDQPGI